MGRVCFVAAGPGEPGMLTVRGAQLLERAGAVAFEPRLDARLLERIPAAAERIVIAPDAGTERVAEQLARAAGMHETLVRLGCGDPLGFGLAAEAAAVERLGVEIEAVPGIPVVTAGPALAGVALAGARDGALFLQVRWDASGAETFVVETRASGLEAAASDLAARGCPDAAHAIVLSGVGSQGLRLRSGPLAQIAAAAMRELGADEGVLLVAGAVMPPGGGLRWLERRPLYGRTVVVTRTSAQAGDLVRLLEERGAAVRQVPLIRIEPPSDDEPLRSAVRSLATFDWVVFTSANGVDFFRAALDAEGFDARAFGAARVACIGPGTAAALARFGIRPDLVPTAYVAEALLDALGRTGDLPGRRILLPRAAAARPVLPAGLRARGAEVVEIEAYRTVPETAAAAALRAWIAAGDVDFLTFTSSSTVHSFVDGIGTETGRALVAAIGPVTAETARERGLPVHVQAADHTAAGLADALAAHALQERQTGRRV